MLDGRQAQLGTHDELLEVSPLYRDLVGHWSVPEQRRHAGRSVAPLLRGLIGHWGRPRRSRPDPSARTTPR